MSNELAVYQPQTPAVHEAQRTPYGDLERMAKAMAASKLFGIQTPEQAIALMLVAEAEGLHPATAARDYDIIQGRPSMKTNAMQARFQQSGGKITWTQLDDTRACATFEHPASGKVEIDWDMRRAKAAGLGGRDMWQKYPRQMLRSRVVSEGIRTCFPGVLNGMYCPEEVADFTEVTDAPPAVTLPPRPTAATDEDVAANQAAQPARQFVVDAVNQVIATEKHGAMTAMLAHEVGNDTQVVIQFPPRDDVASGDLVNCIVSNIGTRKWSGESYNAYRGVWKDTASEGDADLSETIKQEYAYK